MKTTVEDPVCNRMIDIEDAAAQADYDGWAYFFCSAECRNKFNRQPAKYASRPTLAAHKQRHHAPRDRAKQP